jgi:hypothetical protein
LNDLDRVHLMNELLVLLMLIRLERIVKIRLILDLRRCNQANLETHRSHDLYMSHNTISSGLIKAYVKQLDALQKLNGILLRIHQMSSSEAWKD